MKRAQSCCLKEKIRVNNNKNMLLETDLLKMQSHSLPAGGAFGVAETVVSPVTAVHKAALHSCCNQIK